MGINSRIGIYYGILIDQYMVDDKDKLSDFTIESIIMYLYPTLYDNMIMFDSNKMDEHSDYSVIYLPRLSESYGDHRSNGTAGNYAMSITNRLMTKMQNGPTDDEEIIIETIANLLNDYLPNEGRISIGFHALSFMD